jgi:hypothetical protein
VTERKQCTQSSHSGRHNVYTASRRSSQHTAVVGQGLIVMECHRAGPFSEIWIVDLQLLESGNLQDSGREPVVSIWLYVILICSERRLLERSNWLTRQIFMRKINVREEICYCITAYLNRVCPNSRYLNINNQANGDYERDKRVH